MGEPRQKQRNKERGMLSLEACVSVMAFLLLMLLVAGLFRMFMAQNATAHAALQTAQSLSLDAYAAKNVGNGDLESVGGLLGGLFGWGNNDDFSSYDDWYSDAPDVPLESAIKTRFVAYLTGGDAEAADAMLERLNVADGLDGIDFSKSHVTSGILYVVLSYQLEYDFKLGELGEIEVVQEASSKLWK